MVADCKRERPSKERLYNGGGAVQCKRERPSKERLYNGGGAVPTVSERDLRRSGSIMAEERCRL